MSSQTTQLMWQAQLVVHSCKLRPQSSVADDRWRHLHGGGFSSAVVSEERGDLVLVEVQTQAVHCQLFTILVDFDKIADGDTGLHIGRRPLKTVFTLTIVYTQKDRGRKMLIR